MSRIIFFVFIITATANSIAQQLNAASFEQDYFDLAAQIESRADLNGKACALVKVQAPVEGLLFEGNIVGDIDFKGGEYWVYLTENSTELTIKHNNYYSCSVKLTDFDIHSVQSQRTYILKLNLPQNYSSEKESISIDSNIDSVISRNRLELLARNLYLTMPYDIDVRRGKLFPFIKDGRCGFLDEDLRLIILAQYHGISNTYFSNHFDMKLKIVHYPYSTDYYWVHNGRFWGCIDNKGNTIVPFKFTKIYEPYEDNTHARIMLATDSLDKNYILNRVTGEIFTEIDKWGQVTETQFKEFPTSVLHFVDTKSHKDMFYDKITGEKVRIKQPKNYYFKEFLPFNHIRFQKNKSLEQKIYNNEGRLVTDDGFHKRPYGDENLVPKQYLFGTLGIFDLEKEQYIHNGSSSTTYEVVSSDVIKIEDGIHTSYFELSTGNYINQPPTEANLTTHKISDPTLIYKFIHNILHPIVKEDIKNISCIEPGIFFIKSQTHTILFDKYGSYIFVDGIFKTNSLSEKYKLPIDCSPLKSNL